MVVYATAISLLLVQTPTGPDPAELIKKVESSPDIQARQKPFEISASLARLYLTQGRTKEALTYLKEALNTAEPALAFYGQQRSKLGAAPPKESLTKCEPEQGAESNLASLLTVAKKFAASNRTQDAVVCSRKALGPVIGVMMLTAHAHFMEGDRVAARTGYERVIALFGDPDALYARGALTLDEKPDDVKALENARDDFLKFLAAAPDARQARNAKALLERAKAGITAGGLSKLVPEKIPEPPTSPPQLSQATIEAFQNAPRTPEMEARFTKLIEDGEDALAKGQPQSALDNFRQVMPYQPENPRLRAGMAWALFKLGKPMAENVWRVASGTPEAIDQLGDRLKAKGDGEGAKALWARLAQTVPSYAPKLEGKR